MAINHSTDTHYKDFIKIYKKCAKGPYHFLVTDTTKPADKKFVKKFDESS